MHAVLEHLHKYWLYVKLSKCNFEIDTVNFLDFIISPRGIKMKRSCIQTVLKWLKLICVKNIQMFLRFANFYQCFIEVYFQIAAFLTDLTQSLWKSETQLIFKFTMKICRAFIELKEQFTSIFILIYHNSRQYIYIKLNASEFALTIILSELCNNGQWHSVAFWSCKIIDAETQYETHDSELLVICVVFKQWRHYLKRSRYFIVILSDHVNLWYFMTTKELSRYQTW